MSQKAPDQIVRDLESIARDPPQDPEQRARLRTAAQQLAWSLQSPHDAMYHVLYSCVTLPVVKAAIDMRIFSVLTEGNGATYTASDLAAANGPKGADVTLTGRIARWLAGHGMIDERDEDQFAANSITKALSNTGFAGGVEHYMYTCLPALQVLPEFLENTQYANPTDLRNSPFQMAFNTKLSKFDWLKENTKLYEALGLWMAAQHPSEMTWLTVLNYEDFVGNPTPETPVFVDVGGGMGHQCALWKKTVGDLDGRVVLQDSASVLTNAPPITGVEKMPYNFWEEQPIKGSRIYYFRYIMHDYPDEQCRLILQNTMAAMTRDSVIMIDDVVLPEKGAHPHSLNKDVVMMINFAAMERTENQWLSLFESCGLQRLRMETYNATSRETIQVVGKVQ